MTKIYPRFEGKTVLVSGAGTGFVLHDLYPESLADTIGWALSTWHHRPHHIETLRRRGMTRDFSWERAAREYVRAYETACALRRAHVPA